nr:E3 ubiquitin-protein ligase RNF180 isoform X2 [Hydra vulgaris]
MDCSMDVFMCRKCRSKIFEGKDLLQNHLTNTKCSLWFLQSDEILPWVNELVNEAEWTKGKLYCPNCKARIGSFDFINIIPCECGAETIPAIYCVKSKVDHKKSKMPVIDSLTSNNLHLDITDNKNKGLEIQPQEIGMQHNSILRLNDSMQHNSILRLNDELVFNQSQTFEQLELIDMKPVKHKTCTNTDELTESGECETSLVELLSFEKEKFFVSSFQQENDSFSFVCSKDFSSSFCKKNYHNKIDISEDITLFHQTTEQFSCQTSHHEVLDKAPSNRSKRVIHCKCHSKKYINSYLTKRSKKKNRKKYTEDEFVNISYNSTSTNNLVTDDFSRLVCSNCLQVFRDEPTKNINNEISGIIDWVDVDNSQKCGDSSTSKTSKIYQPIDFKGVSVFENVNQVCSNGETVLHHERNGIEVGLHHERNDRKSHETEILEEHQCPICWDLFYDPYKTICNHIFCSPCLRQLNKSTHKKPLCPLCRRRIYSVTACEDFKNQLKSLYPNIYLKRSKVENRNKNNVFPLPSPANVMFEGNLASSDTSRIVHYLYVIRTLLMVLFMLVSYLLNGNHRQEHRRFARHLRYAFYFVCFFGMLGTIVIAGLLLTLYTYDFAKCIFGLVVLYFVLSKLLMRYFI